VDHQVNLVVICNKPSSASLPAVKMRGCLTQALLTLHSPWTDPPLRLISHVLVSFSHNAQRLEYVVSNLFNLQHVQPIQVLTKPFIKLRGFEHIAEGQSNTFKTLGMLWLGLLLADSWSTKKRYRMGRVRQSSLGSEDLCGSNILRAFLSGLIHTPAYFNLTACNPQTAIKNSIRQFIPTTSKDIVNS
jgi:hypothetical protein